MKKLWSLALPLAGLVGATTALAAVDLIQNPDARTHLSLNGQWSIIVDPYENGYYNHRYEEHTAGYFKNRKAEQPSDLVEYDFSRSQKIQVPGDWNTQDEKLFLYEGTVWYEKDFELDFRSDKRYLLHFGAVNYKAIVYVNGSKVGEHEGGFTPFQFDVTYKLHKGSNFVVVKVDNRRERNQIPTVNTDWWNYGGITRPVSLIELDSTYLNDYSLQYDAGKGMKGWVQMAGDKRGHYGEATVSVPELNIQHTILLDKQGRGQFSIATQVELWSPENPKLYEVNIAYNGSVLKDRIGFRKIAVQGFDILLNDKPVFLRGISIHEESPRGDGRAWSEDDARTLLRWAKDLGCNFVRLAHYPHNETMTRMADEMGLMVWSEIPVYWTLLFEDPAVYTKAEMQLQEMITRDKNRASIVLWSVANETPSHQARFRFLKKLVNKARSLDESRLITAALDTQSTTAHGKRIDDPFASLVDVIGINSYCGWYSDKPEDCATFTWESPYNKPVIMSELGAGALQGYHGDREQRFTEEYQERVYVNNIQMLEKMPFLRGVTPWILKDFRSPRRPLPTIQDFWNRKGLLSEVGVKKKAWFVMRDWYAKKAAAAEQ